IELLMLLAERTEPQPSPPTAADQTPDLAWTRDLAGRQPRPLRRAGEARQHHPAVAPPSKRPRGPVLQANPFVVAISIAIVGAFFLVSIDRKSVDTLHVRRIEASEVPAINGDTSDRVWRTARPLYVITAQGGNFDGKGETTIEVRAVHDDSQAYFMFTWN